MMKTLRNIRKKTRGGEQVPRCLPYAPGETVLVASNRITEDLLALCGAIDRKSQSIIRWIGKELGE